MISRWSSRVLRAPYHAPWRRRTWVAISLCSASIALVGLPVTAASARSAATNFSSFDRSHRVLIVGDENAAGSGGDLPTDGEVEGVPADSFDQFSFDFIDA